MRQRFLGLNWADYLVIAAAGLTFSAIVLSQVGRPPMGPPTEQDIQKLADELGVTADQLRRAAEIVPPPPPGSRPSAVERDSARQALAVVLHIPVERLDTAMHHRHRHLSD